MAMAKKKSEIKQEEYNPKLLFAVRIRGKHGMRRKILDTLAMLRMNNTHHGVLIWATKPYIGMLDKCKDYISYGEITESVLINLIKKRGKIEGNKPLTDDHLSNLTKYKTIEQFAQALIKGESQYRPKDIHKLKPVFRLHPPRKGFPGSIKKHFKEGGPLGNVGDHINDLISRML